MISIIIPTYNEEHYLPLLLQSIEEQHYREYEVIIADHNSTDNTILIAHKYGVKIVEGGMPGKGRNNGAKEAKGNWLLFLDADVVLPSKSYLRDLVVEMIDRSLQIATCRIHPLSERPLDLFLHQTYNIFMGLSAPIMPFAPGFCILIDQKLHQTIEGFDEEIWLGEDSDYVQRAKKKGRFGILKSHEINVSVRRLDRDGRGKIAAKYILAGMHMLLIGKITTDLFKYEWGHKEL